jgi:hypothetical protein
MSLIAPNLMIETADGLLFAFQNLHKIAVFVEQHSGNFQFGVVYAGFLKQREKFGR